MLLPDAPPDDPDDDDEAEPAPPLPDWRTLAAPASCHSHLFCALDHTHFPSGAEEDEEELSPDDPPTDPDELSDP